MESQNVNIDTIQFSHILETEELQNLHDFLSHSVFVISHKNEKVKTLLEVLWYLPLNSPIIIVTNCQDSEREDLTNELKLSLAHHERIYLVHQKEEAIARLFETYGVYHILGEDGKVIDGKGEGMYIGALCAYQLGYPRWIIFYDADNFVPSALLEYTLAMRRLFIPATPAVSYQVSDALAIGELERGRATPDLHNVRICWSSKPKLGSRKLHEQLLGRCTRVVSPLFNTLLQECFGIRDYAITSSNAGE